MQNGNTRGKKREIEREKEMSVKILNKMCQPVIQDWSIDLIHLCCIICVRICVFWVDIDH